MMGEPDVHPYSSSLSLVAADAFGILALAFAALGAVVTGWELVARRFDGLVLLSIVALTPVVLLVAFSSFVLYVGGV